MSIGKNIKELRNRFGLSQKDLALIAGVTDKAVSTWENDLKEPRMGVIQKLADHFGLQKSNIIEDDGLRTILALHDLEKFSPEFQNRLAQSSVVEKIGLLSPKQLNELSLALDKLSSDKSCSLLALGQKESTLMKKYRLLDDRGRRSVDIAINSQYECLYPKQDNINEVS